MVYLTRGPANSTLSLSFAVDFDAPVGYKEPERVPAAPPKPILPEVCLILDYSPNAGLQI